MKHILILFTSLLLSGCYKTGAGIDSDIPDNPTGVVDVWEYSNPDGSCSTDETFGDAYSVDFGCLHYAQLTRFADGAAYITLSLGPSPTYTYTWSTFLPAETKRFDKELNLGLGITYRMRGDLRPKTPTLSVDFDRTGTYSDASPKSVDLVEVE